MRAMVAEISQTKKWTLRVLHVVGLLVGLAMVAAPAVVGWSHTKPLWIIGIPLVLFNGLIVGYGIAFRIRYRTPEARVAYKKRTFDPDAGGNARILYANRATKDKDRVLRSGIDGTAVVTFIADGHMEKGFSHLVYLELDVTVGNDPAYQVRTGEYLTPASSGSVSPGRELAVKVDPDDSQRVAVDWERSLRLPRQS